VEESACQFFKELQEKSMCVQSFFSFFSLLHVCPVVDLISSKQGMVSQMKLIFFINSQHEKMIFNLLCFSHCEENKANVNSFVEVLII